MKRRVITLFMAVLLLVSVPMQVKANTSRIQVIAPRLTFSGTTATCTLQVSSDYATDTIEAVLKLWDGTRCLETWHLSGTLYISFSDTHNVLLNHEYKLTADVKINGEYLPRVSYIAKCE